MMPDRAALMNRYSMVGLYPPRDFVGRGTAAGGGGVPGRPQRTPPPASLSPSPRTLGENEQKEGPPIRRRAAQVSDGKARLGGKRAKIRHDSPLPHHA